MGHGQWPTMATWEKGALSPGPAQEFQKLGFDTPEVSGPLITLLRLTYLSANNFKFFNHKPIQLICLQSLLPWSEHV